LCPREPHQKPRCLRRHCRSRFHRSCELVIV
jgi:hypothetical protein